MPNPLDVVILAAGKGVRMRSRIPKVLHPLAGMPLLEHVLSAASSLQPATTVVVVGPGGEVVRKAFSDRGLTFVDQGEPLGTGHAVLAAKPAVAAPLLLVLPGDVPLVPPQALRRLVDFHLRNSFTLSFLSMELPEPGRYGRVVRQEGQVVRIVEAEDASPEELAIREVNSGIFCLSNRPEVWEALAGLSRRNAQGEYYLTDLVARFAPGGGVGALPWSPAEDLLGVNDRLDLARLERVLQGRLTRRLLREGVSIPHPEAVYLSPRVEVGADTVLWPHTYLWGETKVGEGCELG
ncbi:MAG TPA: bifunctional UDP-N-acetylglucosamine diphosphorylase/glucosamine-1-phosphate N-acetyltransferase GlmU, partial [Candidatus Acetothermia bacterium]|nr:bifunctional UDP-N-acetylglucosamine diphosphorylase/glucosamine-1-phosphate N-acetyltransferase GlmU [Candidatus Acetothermia bacterium]